MDRHSTRVTILKTFNQQSCGKFTQSRHALDQSGPHSQTVKTKHFLGKRLRESSYRPQLSGGNGARFFIEPSSILRLAVVTERHGRN